MSEGRDDAAFTACFQRFYPLIRAKCARMLRDAEEAEDVAQETFARLWQQAARDDIRDATAWIYKTSTRLAIDRLRQRKRRPSVDTLDTLPSSTDIERTFEQRAWLEYVVRTIPERELEVAVLHRFDRLQQDEISVVLGCSERTVRRLLSALDGRLLRLKERLS